MAKSLKNKPHAPFGFMGVVRRFLGSLLLVLATYNPSGFSYVHWAASAF